MTATELPATSVPAAAAEGPSTTPLSEADTQAVLTATAVADSTDVETLHRLRRALRILVAARRRDEGVTSHVESH